MPLLIIKLYLYLLTFILLFQSIFSSDSCLGSNHFIPNDSYDRNLNELTSYLAYATPLVGSSLGSKGHDHDKAYGLSMCFGNYSALDCKNCIINIADNLRAACPNSKGAVRWKGICLLKYLDEDFFGAFEHSVTVGTGGQMKNVSDPGAYMRMIGGFLSNVTVEAFVRPSMWWIDRFKVGQKEEIEGMAYCTGDITSMECRSCLDDSIKLFPQCCQGKKEAVVYGGSCLVRYAIVYY